MQQRKARWVILLATLAGVALTARLGAWQLSRASQKEQLQALLQARGAMPVLEGSQLARDAPTAEAQHHRRVRLQGHWVPGSTVFLDNRQMQARAGFFVITAYRVAADGRVVAVQRGFTLRDAFDREHVPHVPTPEGEQVLIGRIAPPPARLMELGSPASGAIRQNLDLIEYARELKLPPSQVAPFSVIQDDPPATPDALLRHWPAPAVDVQKHDGYAFQWFALSTLMALLYVWFQLIRPRLRRA